MREVHLHVWWAVEGRVMLKDLIEGLRRHLVLTLRHVKQLAVLHLDGRVTTQEIVFSRVAANGKRSLVKEACLGEAGLVLLVKDAKLLWCHHSLVVALGLLLKLQLVHVDLCGGVLLALLDLSVEELACNKWI